jgi:20S proteasome alpha/beta subunit
MIPIISKPWQLKPFTEPWPRRRNRPVTLIAGFTGRGGSVLCSDLLEVTGGYAKKPVDKILTPEGDNARDFEYAIGCSGTGPYMDMLQSDLARTLEKEAKDRDPASCDLRDALVQKLVETLTKFYSTHIWPRGNAGCVEMHFLILVHPRPYGEPFFIKVVDTAVSIIQESYACIGIGAYLADYIFENMHSGTGEKEYQFALASFVLSEVNENVDGCGKGYSIYHFDESGTLDCRVSDYHPEDFSRMKNFFNYAFQTMTDFSEFQNRHGFSSQRIGELIGEERADRLRRFESGQLERISFLKSCVEGEDAKARE